MDNLFDYAFQEKNKQKAPLAKRMRPISLEEFEEQTKVVGKNTSLRCLIEEDILRSIILHGPSGTGKTTLAMIISRITKSHFESLNAVTAGVADIRQIVKEAKERQALYQEGTVLFIDEIHRFNKGQQDALLPFVEDGLIVLIGATTENPLFSVNRPLLSRSRIFRLDPLSEDALVRILKRALEDSEKGLGNYKVEIEENILLYLAKMANGDARTALNCLEVLVLTTPPNQEGIRKAKMELAIEICGNRVLQFNKADEHYDVFSAFIKSMRGSDPHATLYWLARLIYAGEDPMAICRRIMIQAAEDVGLADPAILSVTVAASQAVEKVGLPEARIILAEAALCVALAPKSNSVEKGIDLALKAVEEEEALALPPHLRDSSYRKLENLSGNKNLAKYKYPHDYKGHFVEQQYLPDNMLGRKFYIPSDIGKERIILERQKNKS